MLTLVSALVLLSPDARAEQYLKNYRLFCPPGAACHGPRAILPAAPVVANTKPIQLPLPGKRLQVKHR